jgi:hypothetical protein
MWWDIKAAHLQRITRASEADKDEIEFSEGQIKRSIVYAREDIILLVSHLSSINQQLRTIKITLVLLLLVFVYIAIRHLLPYSL